MSGDIAVVFFDIGSTLGVIGLSQAGAPTTFEPYSYVPPILDRLNKSGFRIGIISNTGSINASVFNELLSKSGILNDIDKELLIYTADAGLSKDSPDIFTHASKLSKADVTQCLYVGEDSWERRNAAIAGMQVCPHPLLAEEVISGERLRFVRISLPESFPASELRNAFRGGAFVPLHVSGRERSKLIGITSTTSLTALANAQLEVEPLGSVDAPFLSDLYLLRDDQAVRTGFLSFDGQSSNFFATGERADWLLSSTGEGLLVAMPAGRSVEEVHFEEADHGHNLKLVADATLLTSLDIAPANAFFGPDGQGLSDDLSKAELKILSTVSDAYIKEIIDVCTGVVPLGDGGESICSRHIQSPDNARIVDALAKRFASISEHLRVRLHPFSHEGKQLFNVEAELGQDASDEIVLVTAHLDSTAASSPPYAPQTDPAPGADDDASGIAGTLAIAEALVALADTRPLGRTIRFVLFNAEEHGLVGSKAYARDQASKAAQIVAVMQMDMIGYNVSPPRSWELHAGFWPSQEVQRRSLELAEHIKRLTGKVSPNLEAPQLHVSEGPSPTERDPAEGRSDHASFQERGYPACTASENFFLGPGDQDLDRNPNYHEKGDKPEFVDVAYAADIARVIAAAAWTLIRRAAS